MPNEVNPLVAGTVAAIVAAQTIQTLVAKSAMTEAEGLEIYQRSVAALAPSDREAGKAVLKAIMPGIVLA